MLCWFPYLLLAPAQDKLDKVTSSALLFVNMMKLGVFVNYCFMTGYVVELHFVLEVYP